MQLKRVLKVALVIAVVLVGGSAALVGGYYAFLMTQIGHAVPQANAPTYSREVK